MPRLTDHYRGTFAKAKQSDKALQRSSGKQDLIAEFAAAINELFPPSNSQWKAKQEPFNSCDDFLRRPFISPVSCHPYFLGVSFAFRQSQPVL